MPLINELLLQNLQSIYAAIYLHQSAAIKCRVVGWKMGIKLGYFYANLIFICLCCCELLFVFCCLCLIKNTFDGIRQAQRDREREGESERESHIQHFIIAIMRRFINYKNNSITYTVNVPLLRPFLPLVLENSSAFRFRF